MRADALYASTFERDPGELFDVKEFGATQMIVALFYAGIDAPHIHLCSDRGILRMFPINFDPAAEIRELAASRAKELMNTETNRRSRRVERVALLR